MKSELTAKVIKYEILKRTFEGKTDPTKNGDALTSKYMPSKKYIAFYTVLNDEGNQSQANETFVTKTEAENEMKRKSQGYRVW